MSSVDSREEKPGDLDGEETEGSGTSGRRGRSEGSGTSGRRGPELPGRPGEGGGTLQIVRLLSKMVA